MVNFPANAADAVRDLVFDGAVIAVGGFGLGGNPFDLIEAVRDSGAKNLTIISNNMGVDGQGLAPLARSLLEQLQRCRHQPQRWRGYDGEDGSSGATSSAYSRRLANSASGSFAPSASYAVCANTAVRRNILRGLIARRWIPFLRTYPMPMSCRKIATPCGWRKAAKSVAASATRDVLVSLK